MHGAARIVVRARPSFPWAAALRKGLFGISADEVRFARRGFPADIPGIRERLERAGTAFVSGYQAALAERGDLARLAATLDEQPADLHGFAHEGAAMSLALVDFLVRGNRWRQMLDAAPGHLYLMLVGAGWAMARLNLRSLPRFARDLDDASWPLLYDGYGFHQGFFHADDYVRRAKRPPLRGYAVRAFDQGLGRSLWFIDGASATRIAATIASFDGARRDDLWSGVGLACGYAGGLDANGITAVAEAAGPHRSSLAQGVVFAASARERAGNSEKATALATRSVCGIDPSDAQRLALDSLDAVETGTNTIRYEAWRCRIAATFAQEKEATCS